MDGRTCDRPVSGYYCPTLDHFAYEAENAKKLDLVRIFCLKMYFIYF